MSTDSLTKYCHLKMSESIKRSDRFMFGTLCEEITSIMTDDRFKDLHKRVQKMICKNELELIQRLEVIAADSQTIAVAERMHSAVCSMLQSNQLIKANCALKVAKICFKRSLKKDIDEKTLPPSIDHFPLLPYDLLSQITQHVDLRSLLNMEATNKSWQQSLNENELWKQVMFKVWFKKNKDMALFEKQFDRLLLDNGSSWRLTFKAAYGSGDRNGLIRTPRAYCKDCDSIFWVSDLYDARKRASCCLHHYVKSLTTAQVVDYILKGTEALSESSEEEKGGTPTVS